MRLCYTHYDKWAVVLYAPSLCESTFGDLFHRQNTDNNRDVDNKRWRGGRKSNHGPRPQYGNEQRRDCRETNEFGRDMVQITNLVRVTLVSSQGNIGGDSNRSDSLKVVTMAAIPSSMRNSPLRINLKIAHVLCVAGHTKHKV